jgi:hypothetical protein
LGGGEERRTDSAERFASKGFLSDDAEENVSE